MLIGVLLLNACLTVQARQANSHQGKGWEKVTDAVIKWLNDNTSDLVFILWGAYAQKKGSVIDKVIIIPIKPRRLGYVHIEQLRGISVASHNIVNLHLIIEL